MRTGIVYAIRCKTNDKVYVGSSVKGKRRWADHRSDLRKGRHHSRHLQRAWNKYGEGEFTFTVLEEVPEDRLLQREQHWMDSLRACDSDFGFNCYPTAGSPLGRTVTEASRRRMSKAGKGRKLSREWREAIGRAHRGSRSHFAKLDEAKVREIKRRLARGDVASRIAVDFKVSKTAVSDIAHGRSWSHVKVGGDLSGDTSGERHWNSRLTRKKVREIRALLAKGNTIAFVAKRFGVGYSTISDIRHGRTWREK